MNRFTSLPLEKIKNLLSEKLSDAKYSDFAKILDLLNDRKALLDYVPKTSGFFDRTFGKSDLYDSENFFTEVFGEGFDILSYRTFPNPFYLKVENKTGVPVFTGKSKGFIDPLTKVSLNEYLQIGTNDDAPTYFDSISVNRDVSYGTLGAYFYQIASIMMVQAQYSSWCSFAQGGRGLAVIKDYTEFKTIPAFVALWGLYGYCRYCCAVVPNKGYQEKQGRRFYAYETWAHGIILDILTQLSESPNPDAVVDTLLSVIRGIKLFDLYVRSSVLDSNDKTIEQYVKDIINGEKTISSLLNHFKIDSSSTNLI